MPKKKKLINGDEHKPATKGDVYEVARMTNNSIQWVVDHMLTKEDGKQFLTKEDAKQFLTKEDAKQFLTKEDAKQFATKNDIHRIEEKQDKMQNSQDDMQSDIERLIRAVDKLVDDRQVSPTQHISKNIPQRVTKLEHDVAILKLGR